MLLNYFKIFNELKKLINSYSTQKSPAMFASLNMSGWSFAMDFRGAGASAHMSIMIYSAEPKK